MLSLQSLLKSAAGSVLLVALFGHDIALGNGLLALPRASEELPNPVSTFSKPVVVQFWATWCKNCGETMQILAKHNKDTWQTEFLTVAVDDEPKAASAYIQKLSLDITYVLSRARLDKDATYSKSLDVAALPYIMVLDPQGKVLFRHAGHPTEASLQSIAKLINP